MAGACTNGLLNKSSDRVYLFLVLRDIIRYGLAILMEFTHGGGVQRKSEHSRKAVVYQRYAQKSYPYNSYQTRRDHHAINAFDKPVTIDERGATAIQ